MRDQRVEQLVDVGELAANGIVERQLNPVRRCNRTKVEHRSLNRRHRNRRPTGQSHAVQVGAAMDDSSGRPWTTTDRHGDLGFAPAKAIETPEDRRRSVGRNSPRAGHPDMGKKVRLPRDRHTSDAQHARVQLVPLPVGDPAGDDLATQPEVGQLRCLQQAVLLRRKPRDLLLCLWVLVCARHGTPTDDRRNGPTGPCKTGRWRRDGLPSGIRVRAAARTTFRPHADHDSSPHHRRGRRSPRRRRPRPYGLTGRPRRCEPDQPARRWPGGWRR